MPWVKNERTNKKTGRKEYQIGFKHPVYYPSGSNTVWIEGKKEAFAEAFKMLDLMDKGLWVKGRRNKKTEQYIKNNITISEAVSNYLEYCKNIINTPSTENKSKIIENSGKLSSSFNNFCPDDIKEMSILDIKYDEIYRWIMFLNNSTLDGGTVKDYKRSIIYFLDYLFLHGFYKNADEFEEMKKRCQSIETKPKSVKKNKTKEPYVPSWKDIQQVTNSLNLGDYEGIWKYTLIYVGFWSGLRPEELAGLKWKHIDFENNEICVRNSISDSEPAADIALRDEQGIDKLKTPTAKREVIMLMDVKKVLQAFFDSTYYHVKEHVRELESTSNLLNDYVFRNISTHWRSTTPYTRVDMLTDRVKEISTNADIQEFTTEALRHGLATHLSMSGIPLDDAINIFGHTAKDMLEKYYAKLDKEQIKQKAQKTLIDFGFTDEANIPKESLEKINKIREFNKDYKEGVRRSPRIQSRLASQIDRAISKGQEVFVITETDYEVWDTMKENNHPIIEKAKANNCIIKKKSE